MAGLTLVTAPASEPVTDAEAKLHVRQDGSADDALITTLVKAARETCENMTGRSFITTTWRLTLDAFPANGIIWLPRPNLIAVSSITYIDPNGDSQTWSSSNYSVDATSLPGNVQRKVGVTLPLTRVVPNAVTVNYTAGYGASASYVPDSIKAAMKLLIGHWYNNRESVTVGQLAGEIPMGVHALLAGYKVVEAV